MRLLMSAAVIVLGISAGSGCRMCDSCYPHGPVVGTPGCATCGTGSAQPYYNGVPEATTISPTPQTLQPVGP